uniref:Uncharacterized protein n=1 Tax=Anguilla anguilla TaxID=7936 RepID=A0A0E9XVC9_ANGAN
MLSLQITIKLALALLTISRCVFQQRRETVIDE